MTIKDFTLEQLEGNAEAITQITTDWAMHNTIRWGIAVVLICTMIYFASKIWLRSIELEKATAEAQAAQFRARK